MMLLNKLLLKLKNSSRELLLNYAAVKAKIKHFRRKINSRLVKFPLSQNKILY